MNSIYNLQIVNFNQYIVEKFFMLSPINCRKRVLDFKNFQLFKYNLWQQINNVF